MVMHHRPFAEPLRQTATDRLFELGRRIGGQIKEKKRRGYDLKLNNDGKALVVKLIAREGSALEMTDTGCYVSCSRVTGGPGREGLTVLTSIRAIGKFDERAACFAGVVELLEISKQLADATRGYEYELA